MNPETWDGDYNDESLTPEQLSEYKYLESVRMQEERRRRSGIMEVPNITDETIIREFAYHNLHRDGDDYPRANWSANKLICVCHNCGIIGFKWGLKETYRCWCKSRNVTICRAGYVSIVFRRAADAGMDIGLHMEEVFAARKERLKAERKKRAAREPNYN